MRWWRRRVVIGPVIVVVVVVAWALLWPVPKPPDPLPDSDEALRELARSENPDAQLAALVILATRGDDEAAAKAAGILPGLNGNRAAAVQWQIASARDPDRISPKLVAAMLERPDARQWVYSGIPPGKEADHLDALRRIALKLIEDRDFTYANGAVRRLVKTGNRAALLECETAALRLTGLEKAGHPEIGWMAHLLFALHADDPAGGWKAINTKYAAQNPERLKIYYAQEFLMAGEKRGVVETWKLAASESSTSAALPWDFLFTRGDDLRSSTPQFAMARTVAFLWQEIPEAERRSLSAQEQDLFAQLRSRAPKLGSPLPESFVADTTPPDPVVNSHVPWRLRRWRTAKARTELKSVAQALEGYYIDYSQFPARFSRLTTPVAYLPEIKPDICAVSGPYGYGRMRTAGMYVLLSAGPDGIANVGPEHLLLTTLLAGESTHDIKPGSYIGWTPQGYEFSPTFRRGMDMVRFRQ